MRTRFFYIRVLAFLFLGFNLIACTKKEDGVNKISKVPRISTAEISSITESSAVSGGDASSEDGSLISLRGVCWGTHSAPTKSDNYAPDGKGIGVFSTIVNGLTPNTTYYLRAFATNEAGTGFGNELVFKTLPAPVLSTANVFSVSLISAFSGGFVSDDGGSSILERGVCWKVGGIPTIDDSRSIDGGGLGSFNSSINGLNPNTTYQLRAYAKNASTTGYGNLFSFTTSCTDIDGNVYNNINIGAQVWMSQNLRVTKYSNGDPINFVSNNSQWNSLSGGAYCDYSNTPSNGVSYGHLYNYFAVHDQRKIAPSGWHIPTDAEWNTLIEFLGGNTLAGGELKESGTFYWSIPNTGASNGSEFSAYGGGYRFSDGTYLGLGLSAYFWTDTQYDSFNAWQRNLKYNSASVIRGSSGKNYGLSLRCIRD